MKKVSRILFIVLSFVLFSCTPKSSEQEMAYDSTAVAVSSSAAVVGKNDSTRKFIRTADLRFKVKSVIKSTYDIEDITSKVGGFVTSSNLISETSSQETKEVSLDSSVITTRFVVTNSITIRVPNTRLDTTLKLIARNIVYLDSRVIKADDVALELLSNQLTIKRTDRNESRLKDAIDNRGKKLSETASAEELLLNKQEQADNARIANMSLKDQINFSTINMVIYQNEGVTYEKIANNKTPKRYNPGFGFRIVDALSGGWYVLGEVIIFILNLWGIILLGVGIFVAYKYVKRAKKKE